MSEPFDVNGGVPAPVSEMPAYEGQSTKDAPRHPQLVGLREGT
jgi:hypothetical protein